MSTCLVFVCGIGSICTAPAEYGADESSPLLVNAVPMLGVGSGVLGVIGLSGVPPLLAYLCYFS